MWCIIETGGMTFVTWNPHPAWGGVVVWNEVWHITPEGPVLQNPGAWTDRWSSVTFV